MKKDAKSTGQDGDRLDSWKRIAAYLGKDVRTAMRWSKDGGMPVHRHDGSSRGAVYAYRSEIDEWLHSDRSELTHGHRNPVFVWAGAVLILVLVSTAIFQWRNTSDSRPETPAMQRPWILVTNFENHTGEALFDDTVETALRRELANSRHVLVVAPERIREALTLMKREPGVSIDAALGRELCLRYEPTCAILTGRVDKFDTHYLLSMEVVDAVDGRSVASTAQEAAGENGVLPAIHRLGNWLRNNLGEELAQIKPTEEQLEQVTTTSLRALELYSSGMQNMYLYRWTDAEALFRKALEQDSGFASGHLFVFWALANQGKGSEEEAQSFLERAMELAGSTSESERLFIQATYYDLHERNFEKACVSYRTLAGLFPDHYWAAGNAIGACADKLGNREDSVRYSVQAAELRVDAILGAATALAFEAGDFESARPYVERMKDVIEDGGVPGWKHAGWPIAFTELFAAHEFLDKGLLQDVLREVQRVELARGSRGDSFKHQSTQIIFNFYLALGKFQKAHTLAEEVDIPELTQAWLAFLAGKPADYQEYIEDFRDELMEAIPDPIEQQRFLLSLNIGMVKYPIDLLAPLYEPDTAVAMVSAAGETSPEFMSWPILEAKLQLVRGKQMLDKGQAGEAIVSLKSGVRWFRDRGGWGMFPYYFLGTELLAIAYAEQGDLQAAYRLLEDAAGRRIMVNTLSTPLHQRILARLALIARELGRTARAESIESELAEALRLADEDHPILVQIREQHEVKLEID